MIHYYLRGTQIFTSVACGRIVSTTDASECVKDVTCKTCLRSLMATGDKALKQIIKLAPAYKRMIRL